MENEPLLIEAVAYALTAFNCVEACLRGIDITRALAEVKMAALRGKIESPSNESPVCNTGWAFCF